MGSLMVRGISIERMSIFLSMLEPFDEVQQRVHEHDYDRRKSSQGRQGAGWKIFSHLFYLLTIFCCSAFTLFDFPYMPDNVEMKQSCTEDGIHL